MNDTPAQTAFPTAEEMQRALRQSGILDKQSIFPGQDPASYPGTDANPGVQLANAKETGIHVDTKLSSAWFKIYIPKIVGVGLIFQGLYGIYKSIFFILVEFPELEMALEQQLISSDQVNSFATKAVVTVISTVISMFFAMRLTLLKSKAARSVNTVIGLAIFFGNSAITSYFNAQHAGTVVSEYSVSILEFGSLLFSKFSNMLQ
jgi:hypothetical protein